MIIKNKVLVGVMFSMCIVIGYSRKYILEMQHINAVDAAFYSGIFMGAMILQIMYCLKDD